MHSVLVQLSKLFQNFFGVYFVVVVECLGEVWVVVLGGDRLHHFLVDVLFSFDFLGGPFWVLNFESFMKKSIELEELKWGMWARWVKKFWMKLST